MIDVRQAGPADVEQLVAMRRAFKLEEEAYQPGDLRPEYEEECRNFFRDAVASARWRVWVAAEADHIVAHACLQLIPKVPTPLPAKASIAYLTNVYARPEYRNRGIGTRLVRAAQDSAVEAGVELVLVWPSERSRTLYRGLGFEGIDEPLVWEPGA